MYKISWPGIAFLSFHVHTEISGICRGTSGDKLRSFIPERVNMQLIALANIKISGKGTEGNKEGS